jgi:NDP-sugar pyrophosphorylase family protein
MEKFLGILFCGGKGTRLGKITEYISKSFIPIFDRPVFMYGLELLEKSKYIDEIIILTNKENDEKLKQTGYQTIIQDDKLVYNMPTGWNYIKKITETHKNAVLVPSDNISNLDLDELIKLFISQNLDFAFSLFKFNDKKKLSQSGCYDINSNKFYYKHPDPPSNYGTIAPYIIRNFVDSSDEKTLIENFKSGFIKHIGYWFDIGDYESIISAYNYFKNK